MSRSKSDFFNSWKSDNFPKIEEAFKEKGIDVVEFNDVQHYQGFNQLGRRIKRGEKSREKICQIEARCQMIERNFCNLHN